MRDMLYGEKTRKVIKKKNITDKLLK